MIVYLIGCIIAFAAYWLIMLSKKDKEGNVEVSLNDIGVGLIVTALSWAAIIGGGLLLASVYFEDHGDDPIITIKKKKSE